MLKIGWEGSKMKKNKSREGFTLIELFLVVTVLVILAGTMMISGDESIASAEANNIINNMRVLKTAALEWLADHGDYIDHVGKEHYMVTYPYPFIMPIDQRNKAEQNIQNVMRSDEHGRDTVMKYIKTSVPISVNEGGKNKPYATEDGYAIIDASGGYGTGLGIDFDFSKWYVVYNPRKNNKKVMKKLEDRAEEYKLYKNATEYYTADANPNYVYMEIIDLAKK